MPRKTDGIPFAWEPQSININSALKDVQLKEDQLLGGADKKALSEEKKKFIDNAKAIFELDSKSGLHNMPLYHADTVMNRVYYNKLNTEIVFPAIQKGPANIVIGKDRPEGEERGYGAINPAGRSETVDIVVGRHSSSRNGKGPKDETWVDNNFFTDAARIYISQMTDIDLNFGIDISKRQPSKQRSGIGIKADGVRIIGREGVKIVTGKAVNIKAGRHGETNSFGGKIEPVPPIELIAGNMSSGSRIVRGGLFGNRQEIKNLQPVVMGDSLVDALEELLDIVESTNNSLTAMGRIFASYCTYTGIDPFRPWVPPASFGAGVHTIIDVNLETRINYIKSLVFRFNRLNRYGYNYICSRSVFTT